MTPLRRFASSPQGGTKPTAWQSQFRGVSCQDNRPDMDLAL